MSELHTSETFCNIDTNCFVLSKLRHACHNPFHPLHMGDGIISIQQNRKSFFDMEFLSICADTHNVQACTQLHYAIMTPKSCC